MYIGNTYGGGTGVECFNNVNCHGHEVAFKECRFTIAVHDDPSRDVSICCYTGMIFTVSVTVVSGIYVARQQSSCTAAAISVIIVFVLPVVCCTW